MLFNITASRVYFYVSRGDCVHSIAAFDVAKMNEDH